MRIDRGTDTPSVRLINNMNTWALPLIAAFLAGAVFAQSPGNSNPRGKRDDHEYDNDLECYDMRYYEPLDALYTVPRGFVAYTEDGEMGRFCQNGCCRRRHSTTERCCRFGEEPESEYSDEYDSDSREWHGDDDDHDKHHHGHHKKALIIVGVVAGVLVLVMAALVVCVCVLKKKARKATRVQNSGIAVPYMTGLGEEKKQPLPASDEKSPAAFEAYVIKGVPPPTYTIQPDAPPIGQASAENPPSYSTLTLQEEAREEPTPGVLEVKAATTGPV